MKHSVFLRVLEFLYTGTATIKDKKDEIVDIMSAAETFNCKELQVYCQNILDDNLEFNPSIGTWLNDRTSQKSKHLFFNKELLSDLSFSVEDQLISVHKSVITSRCDVLSAMFSGKFVESINKIVEMPDSSAESFLAFLEYIYTEHSPIEENDAIGIFVLSDRFQISRLRTLCELYISKMIERACKTDITKADIDVIGLLHLAQSHNAKQLADFCLHFIATNYQPMKKRPEFETLKGDNLRWIEENQWPPVSYFKELEAYEKLIGKSRNPSDDKNFVIM